MYGAQEVAALDVPAEACARAEGEQLGTFGGGRAGGDQDQLGVGEAPAEIEHIAEGGDGVHIEDRHLRVMRPQHHPEPAGFDVLGDDPEVRVAGDHRAGPRRRRGPRTARARR